MKKKPGGRLRLLPIVTIVIGALGVIKILALVLVGGYILQPLAPAIAPASAQEAGAGQDAGAAPPAGQAEPQAPAQAPVAAQQPAENIDGRRVILTDKQGRITEAEAAVLESLRKRREALDARERALEMQANLLQVAENRIDEKLNELKALQTKIDASFKQREQVNNKKLAGLVTIYENMKPKEAARIFNGLDLPVLLGVARLLKPRKMSPILAKMDAGVAQTLTVRIAEINAAPAPANGELESIPQSAN